MKVDQASRDRLYARQTQTQLNNGLGHVVQAIQNNNAQATTQRVVDQIQQLNASLEQTLITQLKPLTEQLQKGDLSTEQFLALQKSIDELNDKVAVFASVKEKIDAGQTIIFPKETQLSGKVDIGSIDLLPAVKISNLSEINIPAPAKIPEFPKQMSVTDLPPVEISNLIELVRRIDGLQLGLVTALQGVKTQFPDAFSIKDEVKINQFGELLDSMEELKKGFNLMINKEVGTVDFPDKPVDVNIISGLKYPTPVTHMSLNSLKGPVLSTSVSVGTSATPLPATPLRYRRSIVIYNNGASTIYVGGANVTTGQGLPVPAGTYAPAFDSGVASIVYGISGSGSVDIRVLESSDYDMGF